MGASCCAQQTQEEQNDEIENKFKYDPNKQPNKGALSKKNRDEKKFVKFPTRVRQEDDEKQNEDNQEDDLAQMEQSGADLKSHKSHVSQKSHKTLQSSQSKPQEIKQNKKDMFNKQVSQFVKCEDD